MSKTMLRVFLDSPSIKSSVLARSFASRKLQQQQQQQGGRRQQQRQQGGKQGDGDYRSLAWLACGVLGMAGGVVVLTAQEEDEYETDIKEKENRVRMFAPTQQIFDYFASYQLTKENGKKVILMGVKEFYNAVTPESTITHGSGRGTYVSINMDDLGGHELYMRESLPLPENSVLNSVCKKGLLTYTDFYFLLNIISTPKRYIEIMFHSYDVNADYSIHAREFAHVIAKVANYSGDPEDLLDASHSGLLNYLFGKDREKVLYKEDLFAFQDTLINELLLLEYKEAYGHDKKGNISEIAFCQHLLKNAPISPKRKERMIARVVKKFGGNKNLPGISFRSFKNFHHILFGGSDLERAMFFMDTTKAGVNKEEFINLAKWVSGYDVDDHVVDVIYTLLDEENETENCIASKDFSPILFEWRHARGFERRSLQVSLGYHKI